MDMMQVKKTVSKNVAALLVMGMAVTMGAGMMQTAEAAAFDPNRPAAMQQVKIGAHRKPKKRPRIKRSKRLQKRSRTPQGHIERQEESTQKRKTRKTASALIRKTSKMTAAKITSAHR